MIIGGAIVGSGRRGLAWQDIQDSKNIVISLWMPSRSHNKTLTEDFLRNNQNESN